MHNLSNKLKNRREEREQIYYKNPRLCKNCNEIISYELKVKNRIFCSSSCAATFNNSNRKRDQESKNRTSQSLKEFHKDKQIEIECKLCHTKFIGTQDTKRNSRCPECFIANYSVVHFRKCVSCGIEFLSRGRTTSYCKSCIPNRTIYRQRCEFTFNVFEYPNEFNLRLVETYGWYSSNGYGRKNKKPNHQGASRDHLYSVAEGYKNDIDPKIISHPANCQILIHNGKNGNSSKSSKCSITIDELISRIKKWDEKYPSLFGTHGRS